MRPRIQDKIKTIDAENLISTPIPKKSFLVEGLIPRGLTLLSGASKIGKSWLVFWLALKIAKGEDVWGLKTNKCDVLYLSLEDTYQRLQDRLYKLEEECPRNLRVATGAMVNLIGNGFEEQIEAYLADHPDTKLIIIDTLQKIRDSGSVSGKSGIYAGDYDDMTVLKNIADSHGLGIILVHHLRKTKDADDPFNEISGSTGIAGAADTSIILKRSRNSETGSLIAVGRDIEYQELSLKFNSDNHIWEFIDRKNSKEIEAEKVPDFIYHLIDYIKEQKTWKGTASDLIAMMNEDNISPRLVVRTINHFYYDILLENNIIFETKRYPDRRLITLVYAPESPTT